MEHDVMTFMNLYEVFGYIQGQAWSLLPKEGNREIDALNNRQIKAMMLIYMRDAARKEPLTLSGLAGFLNLKKAAASLLVSDLAQKQLVDRTIDPINRRFIRITLAAKGRKIGNAVSAQAAAHAAGLLDCLTPEERSAFVVGADKIYNRYAEAAGGAE